MRFDVKVVLGAYALLNMLFMGVNASALSSGSIVADGKGPSARSYTTVFNFITGSMCSETTGQCMEVNGKGSVKFNDEIRATGFVLKYKEEDVQEKAVASHYRWTATKLMNGNEIRLHFKASTGLGPIDIAVTEGKGATSGLVCVWGGLKGVIGENETLCTNNVLVYIN
jgi:hypothetical protein